MSPPRQKPTESRQDYETPPDFLAAVARRFGELEVDLACGPSDQQNLFGSNDTRKAPIGCVFPLVDSLALPWAERFDGSTCWLNPPFRRVVLWARKCRYEAKMMTSGKILLLTPACVGTVWFADNIHGHALVLPLLPRLCFVGEKDPFPKDLMLSVFGPQVVPGFAPWRWKGKGST